MTRRAATLLAAGTTVVRLYRNQALLIAQRFIYNPSKPESSTRVVRAADWSVYVLMGFRFSAEDRVDVFKRRIESANVGRDVAGWK